MTEPAPASWRRAAKAAAAGTGALKALTSVRDWPGVLVLCYHGVRDDVTPPRDLAFAGLHVPAAHLAEHLAILRRYAHPISLDHLVDGLTGAAALPPRAVHVTFDDGYRSVLRSALPLLERADVPASVFVCRRPSERGTLLWYDAMARASGDDAVRALRDQGGTAWTAVVEEWSPAAGVDDPLAVLSPDEIASLGAHPLIGVGGHTVSHPPLAQLGLDEQRQEILEGLEAVEAWTGRPCRAFAYPVGRPGRDYDSRTLRLLGDAGVELAFTTAPGWCAPSRPRLEQPRFVMVDGVDGAELAWRLAWAWRG